MSKVNDPAGEALSQMLEAMGHRVIDVTPTEMREHPYAAHLVNMKATSQRDAVEDEQHLRDRLATMYSHRGDGIPTQYVNPDGPDAVAMLDRYRARADRAEAENVRLRETLRPFADLAAKYDPPENDDCLPPWDLDGDDLTLGHLRVARATLGDPT